MSMKFYLFIIVLITGLFACNKELEFDNTTSLDGKFETEKTIYLKPMVMYVQNRQITDLAIITPYLSRHGFSSYFTTAATQTTTDTVLTVTFSSNDSVSFKTKISPDVYAGRKIVQSAEEWIIQRNDTLLLFIDPYPFPTYRCDTVVKMLRKYEPLTTYTLVPGGSGNRALQKRVPRFPLQIKNSELVLPLISMAGNSIWNYPTSAGNCTQGIWDDMNINKGNFENNLQPNDTIVVQEKTIKMVRIL